ncbi:hypothetical protein Taro_031711 [Colocasia esculenta]|uniref:Uncharacterized protein n=1 Tax=Colocasia esculenta TaxID=4460 RepID=A0A843VQR6_COLES|nr:hypothetical protein [Colocasia esculenta]
MATKGSVATRLRQPYLSRCGFPWQHVGASPSDSDVGPYHVSRSERPVYGAPARDPRDARHGPAAVCLQV